MSLTLPALLADPFFGAGLHDVHALRLGEHIKKR